MKIWSLAISGLVMLGAFPCSAASGERGSMVVGARVVRPCVAASASMTLTCADERHAAATVRHDVPPLPTREDDTQSVQLDVRYTEISF